MPQITFLVWTRFDWTKFVDICHLSCSWVHSEPAPSNITVWINCCECSLGVIVVYLVAVVMCPVVMVDTMIKSGNHMSRPVVTINNSDACHVELLIRHVSAWHSINSAQDAAVGIISQFGINVVLGGAPERTQSSFTQTRHPGYMARVMT